MCDNREQFEMLGAFLDGIYKELVALSKKQPDALMNEFKLVQINSVLSSIKELLADEPSNEYLSLLADGRVEADSNKDIPKCTYSDAIIVVSQFKKAVKLYEDKYYPDFRFQM